MIKASIVMPIYNEELYIEKCFQDLLNQDFPRKQMEWIFVDGHSTDHTVEKLEKMRDENKELPVIVLANEKRTIPNGLNIGIAAAKGEYVIRLDAHASYPSDYISKSIETIERVEADDVGGIVITKARTKYGETIAKMLSTKFGVGNSQFRTDGESGYVDTVPFGCFKRELFDRIGTYDTRFERNEDNEFNYRIRKNGGKIYLNHDIQSTYFCRDTFGGICKMGFQNGMWNVLTMKAVPGAMGIRHFVPFAFTISLIGLGVLSFVAWPFGMLLFVEILLYLLLDIFFSVKASSSFVEFLQLVVLYFCFHFVYGIGSLWGLFKLPKFLR